MNGQVAPAVRSALGQIADGRLARLPFTLRFWDGSLLRGERERPVAVVRSPKALAHLLRAPNQLGLARAWVTGGLEVEGDLEAVLAERKRFADVSLSAGDRLRLYARAPRQPSQPGPRPHLRAPPLRRLQRFLPAAARTQSDLLLRLFRNPRGHARGGAGAQARADLPQAPPRPRRAPARHRLRLGIAAAARRPPPRRARRGRHAVRAPGAARPPAPA